MSEKKNIDRLFQEQFKDFEAAPPEYVWENIHDALQEKKKRRVIPLWFRLGGVAAVLLVGMFISWLYLQDNNPGSNNGVVLDHKASPVLQPKAVPSNRAVPAGPGFDKGIVPPADSNSAIVDAEKTSGNSSGVDKPADRATGANEKQQRKVHGFGVTKNTVAGKETKEKDKTGAGNKVLKPGAGSINATTQDAVAGANTANDNRRATKNGRDKNNGNAINGISGEAYDKRANAVDGNNAAYNNGIKKNADKNNGIVPGKNINASRTTDDKNTGVAQINTSDKNNAGAVNASAENKIKGGVNTNVPVIDKNIPVEVAVAQVAADTVKPVKENELEKMLREQQEGKKEEQVAESNGPKWNIKPQVAPVFYSSLSQGSPIDDQFASNAKSFNNDLSLGVGINYAVTSRLKIRSGINTVNLNYATQDVQFYASLNGSTNNISPQARNANIVVQDKTEGVNPNAAFASSTDAYSGSMVQRTGYLEVPVEMSYALLNRKFGIELIGGVSTLFLNQNNVSVVSTQGLSTSVGEAENLNNIHFSTNVGVGFKYRFLKSFEASFEPMFKYQVNTFSRDAGNFKPYFIGLYSGISFSF